MAIQCDVILQWSATPEQLTAVGTALWRWCNRVAGDTGVGQYVDNQALADLIAGTLPVSGQTPGRAGNGVHFRFRDEISPTRRAAIDSMVWEIPAQGIEDVLIDGISWWLVESRDQTCVTT